MGNFPDFGPYLYGNYLKDKITIFALKSPRVKKDRQNPDKMESSITFCFVSTQDIILNFLVFDKLRNWRALWRLR